MARWSQADSVWNASGVPPPGAGARHVHNLGAGKAPPVPWYTSRFFTNPTCRGFPWY